MMPIVEDNKEIWGRKYNWDEEGEEWSISFSGSDMQWRASISPRIHSFVPTRRILEMGTGFGRGPLPPERLVPISRDRGYFQKMHSSMPEAIFSISIQQCSF